MAKTDAGHAIDPLHPRRAEGLVGHAREWAAFTASLATGRMPHAWLLVGPRGAGKATFAYRAAVEVLAKGGGAPGRPDATDQSILRRVAAGSHGDLLAIERDPDGGETQGIPATAARGLRNYFGLTSAEAGWRVAIVDALDDLSIQGVNALLKVVEEPPPRALLLLIAHRADAVPATIRSRCRRLPFAGLATGECIQVLERLLPDQSPAELSGLAHLANGAPGLALAFAEADALALFGEITGLCRTLPTLDVPAVHAFSERFARKPGSERFSTFAAMFKIWVHRAAVRVVAGDSAVGADIVDGEGAAQRQYSTAAGLAGVLSLWNDVGRIADAAIHAHLDRKQAVLDVLFASRRQARGVLAGG